MSSQVEVDASLLLPNPDKLIYSDQVIRYGGMGNIYKGVYESGGKSEVVALKTFRESPSQMLNDINRRLNREAHIWHSTKHMYIHKFYGAYQMKSQTALVSPWLDNGTVIMYLSKNDRKDNLELILKLVKQTSKGLRHLHNNGIVHGDIKGTNILVDDRGDIKITDFGRTSIIDKVEVSKNLLGTAAWAAPEILGTDEEENSKADVIGGEETEKELKEDSQSPPLSTMSDMWAFGITIVELFHDLKGWVGKASKPAVLIMKICIKKEKPKRRNHPPLSKVPGLWDCLEKCWEWEPSKRIAIDEFDTELETMEVDQTRN